MDNKATKKLDAARGALETATAKLYQAVKEAYPLGCTVRYSTASYDLLYLVVEHYPYGRLKVQRKYVGGPPKYRILEGTYASLTLHQPPPPNPRRM